MNVIETFQKIVNLIKKIDIEEFRKGNRKIELSTGETNKLNFGPFSYDDETDLLVKKIGKTQQDEKIIRKTLIESAKRFDSSRECKLATKILNLCYGCHIVSPKTLENKECPFIH